jgi:tetratricopeptide (TPR) repeat protein
MLVFCPNCGSRLEIPGHMEAAVGRKCPECGADFGGPQAQEQAPPAEAKPAGPLKLTKGGETARYAGPTPGAETERPTARGPTSITAPVPAHGAPAQVRRVDPAGCELLEEIGRRGAGVLYEARQIQSGDPFLVRRLLPEGGSVVDAERWALNASKLQSLRHRRVVNVMGVGLREGSPHCVVDRAAGHDLAELVARQTGGRPLNARQAVGIALDVIDGMAAAHGAGVVHGDLKPSNVFVDDSGRASVCDFGFAPRALEGGEPVASEHVMGWLPYAAPELVREGPDRADERSDSYGLGALLYYMLTGLPPFSADEAKSLVETVLGEAPVPLSDLNPKVPEELSGVVMRAIEKERSRRPANVQAIAIELRRFERAAREKLPAARAARGRPGRRALKSLAAVVLVGAAGFGAYWFLRRSGMESRIAAARDYVRQARAVERAPGRSAEAVELYRRAAAEAEGTPQEADMTILLADALVRAGEPREAADLLERAAETSFPRAGEAKVLAGRARILAGRTEDALRRWERIVRSPGPPRLSERVAEAGLDAAGTLLDSGRFEEAKAVLGFMVRLPGLAAQAGDLGGVEARARALLGEALAALGEREAARKEFDRVLLQIDELPEARARAARGLVRVAASKGPPIDLGPEEEEALGASARARLEYARLLVWRSRANEAEAVLSKLGPEEGGDPAWVALVSGELDEALGRIDAAGARYREAVRLAGESPEGARVRASATAGEARLKLRLGRAEQALEKFREVSRSFAAEAAGAVASAMVGEADSLRLLGRLDEAARRYGEAIAFSESGTQFDVRRSHLAALAGLGEVSMGTRARARAQGHFERLAEEPDAGFLGMIALAMTGEIAEAELLTAAESEAPDLAARAFYAAGLRRELAGDTVQADVLFKRAVSSSGGTSWYGALAEKRLAQE